MLAESELILNADGSVYHLHLLPEQIADTIIVVGDPERVPKVSQHFDSVEVKVQKREFVTHTGRLGNQRISVISSGIGTDNIDILMNELDALVNIDLKTREIKKEKKSLNIIRIGTSGSLKAEIPIDSFLISMSGIGLDTLLGFYHFWQTKVERNITENLQEKLNLNFSPYCISLKESDLKQGTFQLKEKIAFDMIEGNTLTCPGFYGPQGRKLRMDVKNVHFISQLNQFKNRYLKGGITNFEMETAAYYAFSRMLGHNMISLNAILANRITQKFSENPEKIINDLIKKILERL